MNACTVFATQTNTLADESEVRAVLAHEIDCEPGQPTASQSLVSESELIALIAAAMFWRDRAEKQKSPGDKPGP